MAGAHDHSADLTASRIPYWIHQLVELLLGALLIMQGARSGEHTAVLIALAWLLVLLAVCSDGPLGVWPWIGRRLHRVLDFVAAAVLALSPLALGLDSVLPLVILEVAAAVMLWLAFRTEWRKPLQRPKRVSSPPVPPARASLTEVPVARKVGSALGKARDDGPRQLGRLVGKAQRAVKTAKASDDRAAEPADASPESAPESDAGGQ